MKEYFITLILGVLCFPIAFFIFNETKLIAPIIITLGLLLVVFSLIKLSKAYPGIRSFFRAFLEFI